MLRQSYLTAKIQKGDFSRLSELKEVQLEIQAWHDSECEKITIQARSDEMNSSEKVRIYHHELHAKHIRRSSILKLKTEEGTLEGHDACVQYLGKSVGDLLLHHADLDVAAQETLLREVKEVFTDKDNELMMKMPNKEEVKESVWSSNLNAAPASE